MTRALRRDPIYLHRHFSSDIIETCVRWYITYRLSYRDLVSMMAERGVVVSHTTVMRWVLRYVPEFESRFQINGTKTPLTCSETVLDEYAVNIVAKFGDKVINKGVRRVAPDGKTMRVDVVSIDRDGKETSFFLVFKRIG